MISGGEPNHDRGTVILLGSVLIMTYQSTVLRIVEKGGVTAFQKTSSKATWTLLWRLCTYSGWFFLQGANIRPPEGGKCPQFPQHSLRLPRTAMFDLKQTRILDKIVCLIIEDDVITIRCQSYVLKSLSQIAPTEDHWLFRSSGSQ